MKHLERAMKEDQLCDLLMNNVLRDPYCIEGFLQCMVSHLADEELNEEISLWSS